MIGKVCRRGSDVRRLLGYLFREGLAGERGLTAPHTAPRLIAAWDGVEGLEPPRTAGGGRDLTGLAAALNAPLLAAGLRRQDWSSARPVYHLAISAADDDPLLTDRQWAGVVEEHLHRIVLAPRGDDRAVRWVAVRHADAHVHVVATLARQDGRRVWPRNDFYRAREASLAVEARYGLRPTSPADRTGTRQTSRAELRQHARTVAQQQAEGRLGPARPDREVLRAQVRQAAAGASSLTEFLHRLREDGLLVRERFSTRTPGQLTGYAVALPDRYNRGRPPVYFGGGKLAADLTVPRLQARWQHPDTQPAAVSGSGTGTGSQPARGSSTDADRAGHGRPDRFGLTPAERAAMWSSATQAAQTAAAHITNAARSDPATAADAAWAAGDVLAVAGRVVEGRRGGPVTDAAAQYERAARELFGATPTPTAAGLGLRHAGRLLSGLKVAKPSETTQLRYLLAQLVALTETVARLRQTQQRAVQAAAARAAIERLHTAAARYDRPTWTTVTASLRQSHTVLPTARQSFPRPSPTRPGSGRRL
jgi:hypothetical protein